MSQISRRILFGAMLMLAVFSSACSKLKTEFGSGGATAGFTCAGVQEDDPNFPISVVNNGTAISVSYPPATGGRGIVRYMMYSDTNFTQLKDQTQNTTYLWTGVKPGDIVVVGVRCRDSRGESANRNYVVINIPRTGDQTPPNFGGLVLASKANAKQVVLKWDECTDLDNDKKEVGHSCLYKVYRAENLTKDILSTPDLLAVVDGNTPATSAAFVVRAEDANGNQEKNTVVKSDFLLGYVVPLFAPSAENAAGITGVFRLPSVPGLSTLRLEWIEPEQSVFGYIFYQGNARDMNTKGFDFTRVAPTGALYDSVVGYYLPAGYTQAEIPGLNQDTEYYFVVRAVNKVGSDMVTEFNRFDLSNSTLKLEPVKGFAGIDYAKEGAGEQAYTQFDVAWPPVDLNQGGIHDSFRIDYMKDAKCVVDAKGNKTFPTKGSYNSIIANGGPTASGDTVATAVEGLKNYAIRVKAVYTGVPPLEDANERCLDVYTSPTPPDFAGIITASAGDDLAAYTTIRAEWGKASGSFHRYYIQAATDANFTKNLVTSTFYTDINTTSGSIQNGTSTPILPNTFYYVRVVASFGTAPNELTNAGAPAPIGKVLTVTTQPPRPQGEKVTKVDITTPSSLVLTWQKPTNDDAFFNEYRVVQKCQATGASTAVLNELDKILAGNVNDIDHLKFVDIGTHAATRQQAFSGLAADVQCCYGVLAEYLDSNYLLSSRGPKIVQCATPTLPTHPAVQISSVKRNSDSTGWTSATVYWSPFQKDGINEVRWGAASYYRVIVSKDSSVTTFKDCYELAADSNPSNDCTGTIADVGKGGSTEWGYVKQTSVMADSSMIFTGLNGRNSWYFQLRAVNANGTPNKITPSDVKTLGPTPKAVFDDQMMSLTATGQDQLRAVYHAATRDTSDPDKQGTWSHVLVVLNTAAGANAPNTVQYRINQQDKNKSGVSGTPPPYADGVNPLLDAQYDVQTTGLTVDASAAGSKTQSIFVINRDQFVDGSDNSIDIVNLKAGLPACVHTIAVYKEAGKPDRYLPSLSTSKLADCATPQFNTPVGGYLDDPYEPMPGGSAETAFTTILPKVVPVSTGTCTRIEIMYAPAVAGASPFIAEADEPTEAQWRTPPSPWQRLVQPCSVTSPTITGLSAHTRYYAIASAVAYKNNDPNDTVLARTGFSAGGPRRYGYRYTATKEPEGGDTTSATYKIVANDYDQVDINFKIPGDNETTDGTWDRVFIFKAVGDTESEAKNLLTLYNATQSKRGAIWPSDDKKSPSDVTYAGDQKGIYKILTKAEAKASQTWTDTTAVTGKVQCYAAWPVYAPNAGTDINNAGALTVGPYNAKGMSTSGLSVLPQCAVHPNFSAPTQFLGADTATIDATACPDGTAKIKIDMKTDLVNANATNSVEQYHVFIGTRGDLSSYNLSSTPWEIVQKGDPVYDSSSGTDNDKTIYVGCKGKTIASSNTGFIVRYYYKGAYYTDTNTQEIQAGLAIPSNKANFVKVPKAFTGLGYDFLMSTVEASVSGTLSTGSPTTDPTNLAKCNEAWRDMKNSTTIAAVVPPECGTNTGTAVAQAMPGATLSQSLSWENAWWACRRASVPGELHQRLPTEEEWRRASRFAASQYAQMRALQTGGNCNLTASLRTAGANAACANTLGLLDMVGNAREAVDHRVSRYQIPTNVGSDERRAIFGYSSSDILAVSVDNILDRVIRRYHLFDPGGSGAGLFLGSNVASNSPYPNPTDAEAEFWRPVGQVDPANGFRCVAFTAGMMPASLSVFELPAEPVYTAAQQPTDRADWTIPPTKYVKDARMERITPATNATQGGRAVFSATANVNVKFEWGKWMSPTCKGTGCTGIKYHVYRFREPPLHDRRQSVEWALADGKAYTKDTPLDPLAVDISGSTYAPFWTAYTESSGNDFGIVQADISQSSCTSTDTLNYECKYTHTLKALSTGNVKETKRLYNFIIVAEDANGNKVATKEQVFRSPFYTGLTHENTASPYFRLEHRLRRFGVFPLDEEFQLTTAAGTGYTSAASPGPRQAMAWVPMHLSGRDSDFYIHKYEATLHSGVMATSTTFADVPKAHNGTTWTKDVAECHESFARTGAASAGNCDAGTTAMLESRRGVATINGYMFGPEWAACHLSTMTDGDNGEATRAVYHLTEPTGGQWVSAADMGEMEGFALATSLTTTKVRQHIDAALIDQVARALEVPAAQNDNGCNHFASGAGGAGGAFENATDGWIVASSSFDKRRYCQSRFGAFMMSGNRGELSAERHRVSLGLDNGVDGMHMGTSWYKVDNFPVLYDLLRGIAPVANAGVTGATFQGAATTNSYRTGYAEAAATTYSTTHGGWYYFGSSSPWRNGGRFSADTANPLNSVAAVTGNRCAF